jgi:hypothetical protein
MKFAIGAKSAGMLAGLGCLLMPFSLFAQAQNSSPPAAANSSPTNTDKKTLPRTRRVFTNDDIPSRTPGNSTPEIEARLQQLNLCDRACFAQVFKDSQMSFRQRYNYPYPFSDKDDHAFEDAILSRMASLRGNSEWQTLLRNALIAKDAYCRGSAAEQQRVARERASGRPITSADIAADEANAKDVRPIPNYGAATSAIISYKFKVEKDFLLAAIILYKYFEITKQNCSSIAYNE